MNTWIGTSNQTANESFIQKYPLLTFFVLAIGLSWIFMIETGSREMFDEMNRFIELHQLKPVIDKAFRYDEIREALRYLEGGPYFGKVVITY
jgi:NADPH:quinone reductase-like Zn-dependent oxidoreductase